MRKRIEILNPKHLCIDGNIALLDDFSFEIMSRKQLLATAIFEKNTQQVCRVFFLFQLGGPIFIP